jgi:AraC family transcriptional regulator
MDYRFEQRDVPAMNVLFAKSTCKPSEISATLGRLLPRVFASLVELGVRPVGPPFCRYTNWREDECDLEGGIIVDGLVSGFGDIEGGQIGGGPAVHTLHIGPYTELSKAYDALQQWLGENGKQSAGAPFELYLTDPGRVPDSAEWQTEIYWPVVG